MAERWHRGSKTLTELMLHIDELGLLQPKVLCLL
jgi:hypothetical protein